MRASLIMRIAKIYTETHRDIYHQILMMDLDIWDVWSYLDELWVSSILRNTAMVRAIDRSGFLGSQL